MAERESLPRLILALALFGLIVGAAGYIVVVGARTGTGRSQLGEGDLARGAALIRADYTSGTTTVGAVDLVRAGVCAAAGSAEMITAGVSRRVRCSVTLKADGSMDALCR